VSTLVLTFVLIWAGLVVLLWAGSVWFQAYIYSEPEPTLWWRAPAAGSALALFLALWGFLAYNSPGWFPALWDLSPTDRQEFAKLWIPTERQPSDRLSAEDLDSEPLRDYRVRRTAHGAPEYRDDFNRPLPTHPPAIVVEEGDEEHREKHIFLPDMDEDETYYKIKSGQALQYRDDLGRVMSEDRIGQISIPRWDRFFANFLFYVVFLAVWFVSLWLLLRFQWTHALGIAILCWLVMTVVVLPMLLTKVAAVAQQPA